MARFKISAERRKSIGMYFVGVPVGLAYGVLLYEPISIPLKVILVFCVFGASCAVAIHVLPVLYRLVSDDYDGDDVILDSEAAGMRWLLGLLGKITIYGLVGYFLGKGLILSFF